MTADAPPTPGPLRLPELVGARVRLRGWRSTDAHAVREASYDPLIPVITSVPTVDSEEEALAFVGRQQGRLRERVGYPFAVADADDRAVGFIILQLRTAEGARGSIGYWTCPSQRRRGYAAEALQVLTAWARDLPDLDRLELYVEPWNEGSWRAAESAGYEREGLLRAWERVGGEPRDMYMYAQLTAGSSARGEHRPS